MEYIDPILNENGLLLINDKKETIDKYLTKINHKNYIKVIRACIDLLDYTDALVESKEKLNILEYADIYWNEELKDAGNYHNYQKYSDYNKNELNWFKIDYKNKTFHELNFNDVINLLKELKREF